MQKNLTVDTNRVAGNIPDSDTGEIVGQGNYDKTGYSFDYRDMIPEGSKNIVEKEIKYKNSERDQ